ncbi:unnamed protein product [Heligmosomoides polygyrus]|uniref:Uncharacterized protein n=1 Tax=Heligmosomoides polygyrus TaxID=6339 RepID=A0A183GPF8_HELPZ|nr:unnamed protein product [Heligmosomoides polygyrus]
MTAVTIFRSPNVAVQITCNNDSVFWLHLCCLLIKQGPKLVLGSLGAACLRSVRREEMIHLLFSSNNNLHQMITETIHDCNRISETFGDDHTNTAGGPGTQNGLKASSPRLATGPPGSCTAHKLMRLRFSASMNSLERPVIVPTFSVATRVLLTLRDFWTSPVAPRYRPRIRDPRILSTLAGLCKCASAPADSVALSRYSYNVINHVISHGISIGRSVTRACRLHNRVSVFSSARKSEQLPVAPGGGTDIATVAEAVLTM